MEPEKNLARYEARALSDPGLREYILVQTKREPERWNLETLTLAALYFHPDMDAARARWTVAQAGEVTAGQRPNPVLSVGPGYNSTTAIPSPWIVATSLDVPIETAGKRGKRLAQARHLSDAARRSIAATAWDVRTRLRRALLEDWAAQQVEPALAAQYQAQAEMVKLSEGQLEAGSVTQIEVTRERIALEQRRVAMLDARNRRVTARVQLATAIGIPAVALADVEINYSAFTKPPGDLPAAEVRRQALLNRADLIAGLSEYAASEASLRLEIAKQYPDVHLKPGYDYDQGDNKWALGLSLELPLLNRNRGPIAQAEAHRLELEAKFNSLQARVLGEIEMALAAYRTAQEKLASSTRVMEQLTKQERLAEGMLEAGEGSRLSVVAARLERSTAALVEMDTRVKAQDALGQLENALQIPAELATFIELPPRTAVSQ